MNIMKVATGSAGLALVGWAAYRARNYAKEYVAQENVRNGTNNSSIGLEIGAVFGTLLIVGGVVNYLVGGVYGK